MPQNMNVWAANARVKLIAKMGGRCVDCFRTSEEVNLIFDHIVPLSDEESARRTKMGMAHRMVMYRRQEERGEIELRCQSCNVKKSKEPKQGTLNLVGTMAGPPEREDVPF